MRNRYKIIDLKAPHFITSTVVGWLLAQFESLKSAHKSAGQHQVWQEGFHPQAITTEDMLRQKLDYIHYNPVKLGLVDRPEY